jgi:hypothetical protein
VKPVKGAFSVLARRIETPRRSRLRRIARGARLRGRVQRDVQPARRALHRFRGRRARADRRERAAGSLATVEGYACGGAVELIGIVDSTLHANGSFARFDYPSALPAAVQQRMADIARRVIEGIGLDWTLWNIEMMYDAATDRVAIIEVNPDLRPVRRPVPEGRRHQRLRGGARAVHGRAPPDRARRGAPCGGGELPAARVRAERSGRAPGEREIAAAEALFDETLVWASAARATSCPTSPQRTARASAMR